MFIQEKETVIEPREKIIKQYYECDKCKEKIKVDAFDAHKCHLEYDEGNRYPESSHIFQRSIDLCPKCAEEFIMFIRQNGYRVNETNIDY